MSNETHNELLQAIEVPPETAHKASVIWLHGLGDSGNGFAPIVPELRLDPNLGIKFVFPHAPERSVTINNGMRMRAWYDIRSLDMESRADAEGVKQSCEQVKQLIEKELALGIPANKILLAGFSQGGVIALALGTRYENELAGIVALSTYMSEPKRLVIEKSTANQNTPILCCHGQQDDVVPMSLGKAAYTNLLENGYSVSWKEYIMQHNVCPPEIRDIAKFISTCLD